jgi:hypothetical protein
MTNSDVQKRRADLALIRRAATSILGLALTIAVLTLLAGVQSSQAEIATPAYGPKWLANFCVGNEQCAVGDFDGDGRDDVLAFVRDTQAGAGQGDVWVALSNGSAFAAPQKWHDFFCTGSEVCLIADVNGDRREDLAAFVRGGGGQVYVALSDGVQFGARTLWKSGFCLGDEVCQAGDFNGDGRADIVAFTRSAYYPASVGVVWVALSSGAGFGTATVWNSFFCIGLETCSVGDFNGDGRTDIIALAKSAAGSPQGAVWVALSNGSSFIASANRWNDFFCVTDEICGVGDFDGDGKEDIITFLRSSYAPNNVGDVYVGLSSGDSFAAGVKWHEDFCVGLETCGVGDFNGDGRDDVVAFVKDTQTGARRGEVNVAVAGGSGYRFTAGAKWLDTFCLGNQQCGVGDFNGDGKDDALAFVRDTQGGAEQGDVWVALSSGASLGSVARWHDFFCTGNEVCLIADVNGDGRDDLVSFVRGADGDVFVALSSGVSFGPRTKWHDFFCLGEEICNVGDFNGDGRADIVAFLRSAYYPSNVGAVFVALSTGSSFGASAKWHSFFCIGLETCGVGDFNGDGRSDLISFAKSNYIGTPAAGDVFVALSNGISFVSSADKWNDGFCVGDEVCAIGDFDGDGKDDIATFLRSAYGTSKVGHVYIGLSNGVNFAPGVRWSDFFCIGNEICGVGDFNGDGRTDAATFLRDTQAGAKRGEVDIALAAGTPYRFSPLLPRVFLPAISK